MEFITFKQFIYTICVREYIDNVSKGKEFDSQPIRLYYDESGSSTDDWIELGWYDFDNKDYVWERLSKYLNEKILNSIVTDFHLDLETNIIKVWLDSKDTIRETMEQYHN